MGFFPGKQTAKTSPRNIGPKRSGGGGGGGSTAPTALKTSPALSKEENERRMAINRSRGVGDSSGHSSSDPRYGSVQAPSSQFRTGGGAAQIEITEKPPVTRAELQQSLARRQQASRAGRAYATSAYEAVMTSPARRLDVDRQPVEKRDLFRESGPSAKSSYSYKQEGGRLRLFVTPEPVKEKPSTIKLPPIVREAGRGAYAGIKTVGYIVGEPVRVLGKNIEKIGTKVLESRLSEPKVTTTGRRMSYLFTKEKQQEAGIQRTKLTMYGGKFVKEYGTEFKERPGRMLAFTGVGAAVSGGLSVVSLGASKLPKVLPTSITSKTGKIAAAGLVGAYGYFSRKRILASEDKVKEAAKITAETTSFVVGGRMGSVAFLKAQGFLRSFGKKEIPVERLVPPEVLSGKQRFPTAQPKRQLGMFKRGEYAITATRKYKAELGYRTAVKALRREGYTIKESKLPKGILGEYRGRTKTILISDKLNPAGKLTILRHEIQHAKQPALLSTIEDTLRIPYKYQPSEILARQAQRRPIKGFLTETKTYYPHATPALFGRKFTTQVGARPKEAAGLYVSGKGASTYFLRIGEQRTSLYPRSLLPEPTTPTLVYVAPTAVKALPKAIRGSYGKVPYGPSYQFFVQRAGSSTAYVPGVKSEVEAVIPPQTLFRQTPPSYYTTVKGVKVPIKLYDVRAKISSRQYYYPGEDIAARAARYYYPPTSYNVPGSSYAALAGSSARALSRGSTAPISGRVSSVLTSKSPVSKVSLPRYSPSFTPPVTKYSYTPPTRQSVLYSTGGSSYSPPYSPPVTPPYTPPYTPPRTPAVTPPYTPPKPPSFDLEFYGRVGKTRRRQPAIRPFKLQASLKAVAYNIKAPRKQKKRRLSGFEVRPIPIM